jgi:hypothetical protein
MIFEKLEYPFGSKYCNYYLKKNGKLNYSPFYKFSVLWCLLNDKIYFHTLNYNDIFSVKNNDKIIKILLILLYLKNKKFKYIQYNKDNITLLKSNNINKLLFCNYLSKLYENDNNINYLFAIYRTMLSKDIKNKNILVRIFYQNFINSSKLKDLKIDLSKIANYHELYLVLKKKKIVDYYYKKIAQEMIIFYKKIYFFINNIENKKYNNFKDIDVFKLVNKYIKNKSDNKYIKDNLIKLSKKYHIKI